MSAESALKWSEQDGRLRAVDDGLTVFDDSVEHWTNGVLRLMQWSPEAGRAFVEAALEHAGGSGPWMRSGVEVKIGALGKAAQQLAPEPSESRAWSADDLKGLSALGRGLDKFWTRAITGNAQWALAGTTAPAHGLLLARAADGKAGVAQAPVYEEAYFEGGQGGYGYGKLEAQSDWRMEKARRQARQMQGLLDLAATPKRPGPTRFLDVGSGYGFLRQAALELGWRHEGLELSRHACAVAQRSFDFETVQGTLEQYQGRDLDLMAMMDLVEHVSDPLELLSQARERLAPGGLCVIRTPNLLAVEREVFGHRYHSFKQEHLHCFSPESLARALQTSGLEPVHLSTEAHLLQGLLGEEMPVLARLLRGSDILAVGRKKAA